MLIYISALLAGFTLLMWSADKFSDNALLLGTHYQISKIVIGIVVLGFGTSAPELLVSGISAWQGYPGLAIGNALGSNTTNILLILGVTLCILPLDVKKETLKKNFMLLFAATIIFAVLILDKYLRFFDGVLLFSGMILTLYLLAKKDTNSEARIRKDTEQHNVVAIISGLIFGLLILLVSSKTVVWSAVSIAENLGVSDLVIGLTVIALGTSLPELATCVASALKKHSELAIGNIIGSNIFNTLGVTGTASLIATYAVPKQVFTRDFPIMLAATATVFILVWVFSKFGKIPRIFGVFFIIVYVIYIFFIYQQSL